MTFFNDKILTIRNKINHLLPSVGTNTLSRTEISETAENLTNKPSYRFKVFADYEDYIKCQEKVGALYKVSE